MIPGQNVGGYQLVRPLGEGPFGISWLASDVNGTPLVVKLLRPAFAQRPSGQAAFQRLQTTVQVHRALAHDCLARVYGTIAEPAAGAMGMLSDFVEGRLLSHVQLPPAALAGQEPQSLAVLLAWFESLSDVMAWLHTQGIIHGNLKPTNVMLVRTQHGHIAKVLDLSWSSIGLSAPAPGQLSYLSPEQLRGASPSAASDQWSTARMLTQILSPTGEVSYGSLPAVLVQTVQRAMADDPSQRFATMTELTSALRAIRIELERAGGSSPSLDSLAPGQSLGVSAPPMDVEEPSTVRAVNPVAPDRHDTPPMPTKQVPRLESVPPVPSARKVIPGQDTGDFPRPGSGAGEPTLGADFGADAPTDDTFHPGLLDTASVDDEPALSFGSLNVPMDDTPLESSLGDVPEGRGNTTAPVSTVKPKRKLLGVYGFLLMFLAGAIIVSAFKFVGEGTLLGGPPTDVARDAGVAEAPPPPPPPTEPPPPIDTAPPPPPPPSKTKAPPPPPPKKPPPKKAPPTRKPPKKRPPPPPALDNDADLDAAFERLNKGPDAAPPPPAPPSSSRDMGVACDEGDGKACLELARVLLDDKNEPAEAKKTFVRACNFGKAVGCLEAGQITARGGDKPGAKKLFARACKQKLAAGCHAAAGVAADTEEAKAFEQKACKLGRKSSCVAVKPESEPASKVKTSTSGG